MKPFFEIGFGIQSSLQMQFGIFIQTERYCGHSTTLQVDVLHVTVVINVFYASTANNKFKIKL